MLGIKKGDSSKENLRKWFAQVIGPGSRVGRIPNLAERKKMIEGFDRWYERVVNEISPKRGCQEVMDKIEKALEEEIDGIGPKIAGVYLRDIVYRFRIWPQLVEHLYLPIDRHISDILIHKLEAFDERQMPRVSESYFSRKNQRKGWKRDKLHSDVSLQFRFLFVFREVFDLRGTVKFFDRRKNYGFIEPAESGEEDHFVHRSDIESGTLNKGDIVDFDSEMGKRAREPSTSERSSKFNLRYLRF